MENEFKEVVKVFIEALTEFDNASRFDTFIIDLWYTEGDIVKFKGKLFECNKPKNKNTDPLHFSICGITPNSTRDIYWKEV